MVALKAVHAARKGVWADGVCEQDKRFVAVAMPMAHAKHSWNGTECASRAAAEGTSTLNNT